ncbi:hypothetical protein [Kitasatospora sp. SUK 42]|uniref:hypothetical protein n=1 Tax=Kitasatospora sp. SUK 42 TaxID=1588882 RepID=UPI0018CBB857|nr:hypothetical protein [Kitasatospora sp. SUK 42]MBV2152290.1 hypothetical protein [Kitasatospora sp. SUK 42]
MRSTRLPVLAAALLCALGATTAVADAPTPKAAYDQQFSPPITLQPGQSGTASVTCPSGEVPTGGGGRSGGDSVFLLASTTHGDNNWIVTGVNTSSITSQTLAAFVVCTAPGTTTFGGNGPQITLQPGEINHVRTSCDLGQVATGGGWEATGTRTFVSVSAALGDTWLDEGTNRDTAPEGLLVTPMCSTTPHTQVTGPSTAVQPGETATATATCPAGQVATGGGGTGQLDVFINSSNATPDGLGWQLQSTNTDNFPQTLAAQVICTRP